MPEEKKSEVKPIVKTARRKLTLEERVERLEKHRFGIVKPYA